MAPYKTTGFQYATMPCKRSTDVWVLEPSFPWCWSGGVLAMIHEESNIAAIATMNAT